MAALWTPTEIAVAADSKVTTRNGATGPAGCKIIQLEDSFFYSAAGLTSDPQSGYDLTKIIRQAFRGPGGARGKTNDFETSVGTPLALAVGRLKKEEPAFFEHYLEGRGQVLQTIFFGLENGNPVLFQRSFALQLTAGNASLVEERSDCPGNTCQAATVFLMGYSDAAARFATEHHDFWKRGLAEAVEGLVKMEIEEVPQFVGPPIDVLHVDSQGAAWVKRKKGCPAIRNMGATRP